MFRFELVGVHLRAARKIYAEILVCAMYRRKSPFQLVAIVRASEIQLFYGRKCSEGEYGALRTSGGNTDYP